MGRFLGLILIFAGILSPVFSDNTHNLYTFEQYLDEMHSSIPGVDLKNVNSVFNFVFSNLKPVVHVHATENYYYFEFRMMRHDVWGNLRLDAADREKGLIDFAYRSFIDRPEKPEDLDYGFQYKQYGRADGVIVRKVAKLEYDVTYRKKTVKFMLENIPQTLPAGFHLYPDEVLLGRTDDNGIHFVFLYDKRISGFRFVLDPSAFVPEILEEKAPGIWIGRMSGYAYYRDPDNDRRYLIGVDADNVRKDYYYDGPFEDINDNFIRDDYQGYLEKAYPYVRGRIDRRGVFLDRYGKPLGSRIALTPYYQYQNLEDLRYFIKSCESKSSKTEIIDCFTHDYKVDIPGDEVPPARNQNLE